MIEPIRQAFKRTYRVIAIHLDRLTRGRLTPNMVTLFGLAMHVPIAWLIVIDQYVWAALALIFFGLLDTLDGQLAQVQKRESAVGMMFDTITDRIKEVILYIAIAYSLIATTDQPYLAVWAVAACGFSLLPGYINAWGDAVTAKYPAKSAHHTPNKAFRGGLLPFEIRMTVLILGLLTGRLALVVMALAVGAAYTAISRLALVAARLKDA